MGLWLGALGRLKILPEPDNDLIKEFVYFCNHTCPDGYSEDEIFRNTWFFDKDNNLISGIGKFAEPDIWYIHLKKEFFEKRGYQLIGDPKIVGECDLNIWRLGDARNEEYILWKSGFKKLWNSSVYLKGNSYVKRQKW